jgi:hypothetical protein
MIISGLLTAAICMAQTDRSTVIVVGPDSTIRVGFDYNGDNRIDAYEDISGSDLIQLSRQGQQQRRQQDSARQDRQPPQDASQRRQQQDMTREQMLDMQRTRDMRSRQGPQGSQQWQGDAAQSMTTVTGEIDDLKQVRLSGMRQRHIIARIETEDGQLQAVDLGPRDQINPLRLQTGDWISVRGMQGSINRNKMLMAMQVRTDDQEIRIMRPRGDDELRFAGKVRETSVRNLADNRRDRLVALVELENRERVVVDLGNANELQNQEIELRRNDQVVFMARPASFVGRNLLAATQLSVDGRVVQVF